MPGALLLAGPDKEVEVELDAPHQEALETLVERLAAGTSEQAVSAATGAEPGELRELVRLLEELGALAEEPGEEAGRAGRPLAAALLDAVAGAGDGTRQVWTADELLLLPDGVDASALRRTLRAFVGGMESHARMAAYCQLVRSGKRSVRGDRPAHAELTRALERASGLDPAQAHVVSLRELSLQSAEPGGADAGEPHRLGPVTEAFTMASPAAPRAELVLHGSIRPSQPPPPGVRARLGEWDRALLEGRGAHRTRRGLGALCRRRRVGRTPGAQRGCGAGGSC